MVITYSIIIPHFNDEKGLERLLVSIPKRADIQVLIIDDRSASERFKDVAKMSDLPNVTTFINDRVKSAGTCRNIGLDNAVGKYLIFADADDFFTKQAFDIIDEAIFDHLDSDLLYFNVTSIDQYGYVSTRHLRNSSLVLNHINNYGAAYEEKLRFSHNVPWGKVVKHSLVQKYHIRFDQTIIANDGMFSLTIGKYASSISAIDGVIYCVTSTPGSLTRKKDASKFRVRLEVYVRYFHFLNDLERKKIGASPLPLLYLSLAYGPIEFFRSVRFLKENKVSIFSNFKINKNKIIRLFKK